MSSTKLAIAIDLDQLRALAHEYIAAMGGDGSNDITERLTLSSFIEWLRQKQQTTTIYCWLCRRNHPPNADSCRAMDGIQ